MRYFLVLLTTLLFSSELYSQCITGSNQQIIRPENPTLPSTGPFCPGEKIEFCFELHFTADPIATGNNCSWVQGVIPRFGDGWDLAQTDLPAASPTDFFWLNEGSVDYNISSNPNMRLYTNGSGDLEICHVSESNCLGANTLNAGDLLPAGWWSVSPGSAGCANDGNPNTMWGLPIACGSTMIINFCFDLVTKGASGNCQAQENLNYDVGFYVFADGETGCWSNAPCSFDPGIVENYSMECYCSISNSVSGNNDCPPNLLIEDAFIDNGFYEANQIIEVSNSIVLDPDNVFMRAGNEILLEAGFFIELGSEFEAVIDDCNP